MKVSELHEKLADLIADGYKDYEVVISVKRHGDWEEEPVKELVPELSAYSADKFVIYVRA